MMNTKMIATLFLVGSVFSAQTFAGGNAVVGAVVGGALGAAIGQDINGRNGAIVGAAIGGATGAAIATSGQRHENTTVVTERVIVREQPVVRQRVVYVRERPVVAQRVVYIRDGGDRYDRYDDRDRYYDRGNHNGWHKRHHHGRYD